jgi:DNA-binding transcriptional ArsR family regulator/YHS domain-containing protein
MKSALLIFVNAHILIYMPYQRLFSLQEDVFKTIASQKRLEVIQLLKNRELSVGEMVEMLGIKQPNLSQHLSLLRRHNIVTNRKKGLSVYYSLADPRIAEACQLIREFLTDQHKTDADIAQLIASNEDQLYPVVQDPVCGMRVSVSEAGATTQHDGHSYYFCGVGCKAKFEAKSTEYVTKEGVIYGN